MAESVEEILSKPKQYLLESFKNNKSQHLNKLRQENKFCDLTLKSDDGFEIKVHKVVVSSASNYFEDLLTTPMKEMYQDCISLPDITGVVLEKIIFFIYTNELEEKIEDIEKIIKYAVIFQLQELIEICSSILVENINNHSCVRYWRLARNNFIYGIESKCLAYIVGKADDLFQKELLNDFTIEEMRCLLAETSLHLQSDEQAIFENVWKWTTGKVSDTITFPQMFTQVIDLLSFSKLNRDFLVERIFGNEKLLEDADFLKQIAKLITNKQIFQDDKIETTSKQILQEDKDKALSSRVNISEARRLLGFGFNQMFKELGKDSTPITKEKQLPQFFGYTTFDNNFFICGGEGSRSCEWLEPISEQWQNLPSMESSKENHACSYFNNKIYACGGIKSKTVEIFEIGNEKWYSGPDMISEISNFGLTTVNGLLYAIGDNKIQILDSRENEWSAINSNLPKISSCCSCVSIGPNIYCYFPDTRNIFDTRVNKFIDEVSLTNDVYISNFCELDGYIYGFGYNWDCCSMELIQNKLDGSRGYSKFLETYYDYYHDSTALVALHY